MEPIPPTRAGRARTIRGVILGCAGAVLGFLLVDSAVFRWGPYPEYLAPDGSTGAFECNFRSELHRVKNSGKQILGIGDSRMALVPRVANEASRGTGYTFASVSLGGSSPRCWYYMLRDLDARRDRYTAILLSLDDFDDEETLDEWSEHLSDLTLVAARLRWSDIFEFTLSYRDPRLRWDAFRGSIMKGFIYKLDLMNFIADPRKRMAQLAWARTDFGSDTYNFQQSEQSMTGLAVDWNTRKFVSLPAGVTDSEVAPFREILFPDDAPQSGRAAAYRRKWIGKILDLYAGSKTRLVFVRPPRGALVRPDWKERRTRGVLWELASRRNAILVDENTFTDLERPALFKDPVHLNREGLARFSERMAAILRSLV
jgi:hypothetical protein